MPDQDHGSDGRFITLHKTLNEKGKPLFINNRIKTTKYTILTFLPKNLFEQFSRIANFYFLIVVALLYVPGVPIEATVAIVPLIIVVGISAIREAVEDFLRYRSDQKVNATIGHKLVNGRFEDVKWQNILVGDFVRVNKDEQVPADLVLFSTDNSDGVAYVDTCNLDGETNLKFRQALSLTATLQQASDISDFNGTIQCDDINNMLYTFHGCLETNSQQYSLDNQQVLLRGCLLRNTNYAIGAVVYTGLETKLMMNSSAARTKRSNLEKSLNIKLVSVFVFIVVWAIIAAACGFSFQKKNLKPSKAWYFFFNNMSVGTQVGHFFILLVSNIVIINAMIPISLYVTLEIVRVFQSLFVKWDATMYDPETGINAHARTSNISDDLGQIEYIFSDKTGTLTCNSMEFMKCCIRGTVYGSGTTEVAYASAQRQGRRIPPPNKTGKAFQDDGFYQILRSGNVPEDIERFLWLLSVCHSVIPEPDPSKPYGIQFQASSPDEAALVSAAADFGYVFTGRSQSTVTVRVNQTNVDIPILAVLEFTSERKRSSVIIREPKTNQIVLYCKGADDLIYQRLAQDCPYQNETREHLKRFADDGLRTLCCAYRVIDENFFKEWERRYSDASCAIEGREELVNNVCNEIESDLILLGATAIEDKLQDSVPETIQALLDGKIHVWIITGDKLETAINIGYACSLLCREMRLVVFESDDPGEILDQMNRELESEDKLALIATGTSLYYMLQEENIEAFYNLAQKCQSVICCRVSPLQKATIVKTMRKKAKKMTLAIGDGANDVGMILEANVGVGISGKEGRQAVLASDYSFSQFKFLKRLLMVHGRLNFYRNVELVNYSFYKNVVFSFCQVIFQFFSSFSGNTVYDSFMYTIFNVIFTSIPPVVYADLERDVSLNSMMEYPQLYYFDGRRKFIMSYLHFFENLLFGILHSVLIFFFTYFGMMPYVKSDGKGLILAHFGVTLYACVVVTVNIRIALMCNYWTWIHHVSIWGSILVFPLAVCVINYVNFSMEAYHVILDVFTQASFYFNIILTTIVVLIPVVLIDTIRHSLNTVTNRVLLHERKPENITIKQSISQVLPELNPISEQPIYPYRKNETGYNFDEPVSLYASNRYRSTTHMSLVREDSLRFDIPRSNTAMAPIIRQKHVSAFGLDNL